jgi:regulator of protease activity HflC (stomatin/prohibitin superfamily)
MKVDTLIAAAILVTAAAVAVLAVLGAVRKVLRRATVHDWEAGLLYRGGRFVRRLGPGTHLLLPFMDEVTTVDLRRRIATVAGQEVLSADGVGIKINVAVGYEVADPERAVHAAQSFEVSLHVAVQLALRAAVAAEPIDALLARRIDLGRRLAEAVAPEVEALGLRLHAAEVKDVMFPGELKRIFAEVVRAQKEGQAALERARGETAALRSLANAARLVEQSPGLMNLRVLQSVGGAAAAGGTVVLGVPQGLVPVERKGTPRGGGGA